MNKPNFRWLKLDPESMSSRARGFLIVASLHFSAIGVEVCFFPHHYSASAFVPLVQYTNLLVWGLAYLSVGVVCGVAAATSWPSFARAGLSAAFVLLVVTAAAVGWGVAVSWADSETAAATVVVPSSLMALAIKDLLMVRQPLRTPTEDLTETRGRQERRR